MHETRNFTLVIAIVACAIWAAIAWLVLDPATAKLLTLQRIASVALVLGLGTWLTYALLLEDRLPDHLADTVGKYYYEADGLSFMPVVRVNTNQAELCVYYQNRFENPVEAIIHLRPPEDSFVVREGLRDIHFAFRAGGGDFGVVSQPIAVPEHLQGQIVSLELAAGSFYPRSHGACWRKRPGRPCGAMPVDWSGSALKSGVHEGSNEMELVNPAQLHLNMPMDVADQIATGHAAWKQERLIAGE